MMAIPVRIGRLEMHEFLHRQGWDTIKLVGVNEIVYSKMVDRELCLRVYTSIVGDWSRDVGEDAIRTVLVTKIDGVVKVIGVDRRVHRVEGWRRNLQERLDNWREQFGPACPNCDAPTVHRVSRRGPFWGCCRYPVCKSIQPIGQPQQVRQPVRQYAQPVQQSQRYQEPVRRGQSYQRADWNQPHEDDLPEHVRMDFEMKHMFQEAEIAAERRAYELEMELYDSD